MEISRPEAHQGPPVPRSRPLACARASKLHFQRWKTFCDNTNGAARQIKKDQVKENAQPCYPSKPRYDFYFNNTFFFVTLLFPVTFLTPFTSTLTPLTSLESQLPPPHLQHPRGVLSPSVAQDLAPRDGARSLRRPHPATSARRPAQPSLPTKRDPGDTAEGL